MTIPQKMIPHLFFIVLSSNRESLTYFRIRLLASEHFLVDRAGFEPAAFRFFSLMRTGRSLAHIQAYQAELPAPALEIIQGLNSLSKQNEKEAGVCQDHVGCLP